ncbi:MAG: protein kinase [Planctomycetes bacterium]|nr:protein kinase [Planctomycetota bacterium]
MSPSSKSSGQGRTTQIAGYTVESKLGQGGMGVVYKAIDSMNRTVALKVLPAKFAKNERFVARFLREARSAGRLQHANIVKAYDVGQSPDGLYFFAMEFVEGESLMQRIKRQGPLPEQDALPLILGVAQGLHHAEGTGMVHRDIKPDNILIDREGTPKITDFGLAKTEEDPTVTQAGGVVGSPQYMSPEQARGEQNLDIRTDLYSLGATFYHAVTGVPPFRGESAGVILSKVLKESPRPPQELNPGISESVSRVILKMLAKEASGRYANTADLIGDLEKLKWGEPPSVMPAARLPRLADRRREAAAGEKKTPVGLYAAAALVLIGLGVAAFVFTSKKSPASPPSKETAMAAAVVPASPAKTVASTTTTTAAAESPAPPPADPAAGMAAIEQASAYRASSPSDYPGQLERFRAVQDAFKGTEAASKAAEAAAEVQARWDAEARSALDELNREADALGAQQKYGFALAVFDRFPPSLRAENWEKEMEQRRKVLRDAASDSFRSARDEATRLAAAGQLEAALKALEPALAFEIDEIRAQAEAERTRIGDLLEKARAESEEKALQVVRELMNTLRPILAARDYEKAQAGMDKAARGGLPGPAAQTVASVRASIEQILKLWGTVDLGAKTLKPGEPFSLRGTQGKFVNYQDKKIYIDVGGPQMGRNLAELKLSELVSLAQKAAPAETAQTHLQIALLSIADRERDADSAKRHIEAAANGGLDVAPYREFFDLMEKGETEAEAQALLARSKSFLARKEWKRALEAVQKLKKDYAETAFVKTQGEAIAAVLASMDEAIGQEASPLFARAAAQFNKGQVKECRETLERIRKEYAGSGYLAQNKEKIDNLLGMIAQKEGAAAMEKLKSSGAAGFVEDWHVIGPFESNDQEGFSKDYLPDLDKVSLKASYPGQNGRKASWHPSRRSAAKPGMVDLRDNVAPVQNAAAYAYTVLEAPADLDVQVRGGSDDSMTVWINGEKVMEKAKWYGACTPDEHVAAAQLRKGKNAILVKVCQGPDDPKWENGWAFYFRFCDGEGQPIMLKPPAK